MLGMWYPVDPAYFTKGSGQSRSGYYSKTAVGGGEPAGRYTGKGAAGLGLTGLVDNEDFRRLYDEDVTPSGVVLDTYGKRPDYGKLAALVKVRAQEAREAYKTEHPFWTENDLRRVESRELGKARSNTSMIDLTFSAVKSVSVVQAAAYWLADHSGGDEAARLEAAAQFFDTAALDASSGMVAHAEQTAIFTRTGHHGGASATEAYRDGRGLIVAQFVQHTARSNVPGDDGIAAENGDPHLHVHNVIKNLVQRADGADDRWRAIHSTTLRENRLALSAVANRLFWQQVTAAGYPVVTREDGNDLEIGGVSRATIEAFSTRAARITEDIKPLLEAWKADNPGQEPPLAMVASWGHYVNKQSRQGKEDVAPARERLADWEKTVRETEAQALDAVLGDVAEWAVTHDPPPPLTQAVKYRAVRIAVAEVTRHHPMWTMNHLWWEFHRALPPLPADVDPIGLFRDLEHIAVTNQAGTHVRMSAPVTLGTIGQLGVRKDGWPVRLPPQPVKYTTDEQLALEDQIASFTRGVAKRLITVAEAQRLADASDLDAAQRKVLVGLLTSERNGTVFMAPAGAGKTHVIAQFSQAWKALTGNRVIGLSTSENAARVMQSEGVGEAFNIAAFLGKVEGSDRLRYPVALAENDVLVIDESSQVDTADLALIADYAAQTGARMVMLGDTHQLGSVGAGGMMRETGWRQGFFQLHEVRRFDSQWERDASLKIREGDTSVLAAYDTRGRVRGMDEQAAYEDAALAWVGDHLKHRDVLLLAATNAEAAELSRRVQGKLIAMGQVQKGSAELADGNTAGVGDLLRARKNVKGLGSGARPLTNRDNLTVVEVLPKGVRVERRDLSSGMATQFTVPFGYLKDHTELGYAGNVHVAQGRTVDSAHLLVSESLNRASFYVGMTRGRMSNTAHVVTGQTAPEGHPAYDQATAESVVHRVMAKLPEDASATETIRVAQEQAEGGQLLLGLWAAASQEDLYPAIDARLKEKLSEADYARYEREYQRPHLQKALREAQMAGADIHDVIDQVTANGLDGAKSIAAVLQGRVKYLQLPNDGVAPTWAKRTQAGASPLARESAEAIDARSVALGARHAARPEVWLSKHLGTLAPDASPAIRLNYEYRAGKAALYREAAGWDDPEHAFPPSGHPESPELQQARQDALAALEVQDEAELLRQMDRGGLEARQWAAERVFVYAPPDAGPDLKAAREKEAALDVARAQAETEQDHAVAVKLTSEMEQVAVESAALEKKQATFEQWSDSTKETRLKGDQAQAELNRRNPRPVNEPIDLTAEVAAISGAGDRALSTWETEAKASGQEWPPKVETKAEAAQRVADTMARRHQAADALKAERADRQVENDEYVSRTRQAEMVEADTTPEVTPEAEPDVWVPGHESPGAQAGIELPEAEAGL